MIRRLHEFYISNGIGDLSNLLQNGRFYMPQGLPPGYRKMRDKDCFRNAEHLALRDKDAPTYVEGMATTNGHLLPIYHAWVTAGDGKVIDPTWYDGSARCTSGTAYFGVEIPRDEIARRVISVYREKRRGKT